MSDDDYSEERGSPLIRGPGVTLMLSQVSDRNTTLSPGLLAQPFTGLPSFRASGSDFLSLQLARLLA